MTPEAMRLFVAISIPEIVRHELAVVQDELRPLAGPRQARWVLTQQMHLTLKFLGNVPAGEAEKVARALAAACSGAAPFALAARGIGVFPSERAPRVLWIGFDCPDNGLADLQSRVAAAVAGWAERAGAEKFVPHATLARLQGLRRGESERILARATKLSGKTFGEWRVDEIELIRSELLPSGSRYTAVASVPLG